MKNLYYKKIKNFIKEDETVYVFIYILTGRKRSMCMSHESDSKLRDGRRVRCDVLSSSVLLRPNFPETTPPVTTPGFAKRIFGPDVPPIGDLRIVSVEKLKSNWIRKKKRVLDC